MAYDDVLNARKAALQARLEEEDWNSDVIAELAEVNGAKGITLDGSGLSLEIDPQTVADGVDDSLDIEAIKSSVADIETNTSSLNGLTSATRGSEQALSVQIVDADGNQITSFGGGGGGGADAATIADGIDDSLDIEAIKSSLADIDANTDGLEASLTTIAGYVDGLETSASSIATNTSSANTLIGAVDEIAPATDTASSGLNGRLQRIAQRITSLIALFPSSIGQKNKAGSLSVALASDQDAVGAKLQDGSGNSITSATRGSERALSVQVVDAGGNQVTSFGGGGGGGSGTEYIEDNASAGGESMVLAGAIRQDTPSTTTSADGDYSNLKVDSQGKLWVNSSGAATETTLDAINDTAAEISFLVDSVSTSASYIRTSTEAANVLLGAVTETAPASDTASSGLNGRLQRIAQRITSLIGLLPTSLGVKTAANSFPVTLSSDGTFATAFGTATDGAAASDTANTGFISLFKRLLSVTLLKGTQTAANSIAVAVSSDGVIATRLGTNGDSASLTGSSAAQLREIGNRLVNSITTYTHSTVSPTTSSGTVIASNSSRKHLLIVNTSTTIAYIRMASSGATTSDIPLAAATATGGAGGSYEINYSNLYTGAIVGITSSGTATLSLMEGV